MTTLLLVSSKSHPNNLAKAIISTIRENENGTAEIQAIGAGAVNQTVKGLAIARGYVAASGEDITFTTSFADIELDDGKRTALKFQAKAISR